MSELDDENDYTLVFDHFYTNNHIQILKSLLPFFDAENNFFLPILIKYLELQHTISLTMKGMHPMEPSIKASSKQSPSPEEPFHAIKKYLAPNEEKTFQQIINMMHTMDNVKEMQKMMELFQSMNGDGTDSSNPFPDLSNLENIMGDNSNIGDMMKLFSNMKNDF